MILEVIKYIYSLTAIPCVLSIFDDDAHRIISKEGSKILDDNSTVYMFEDYKKNYKKIKNTMNTKTIF